ncbi:hypothetical protein EDC01DRAFT_490733 [Geopyxis carbonaria]|nr:hypothetical protein EDC01DRAFT_490733 [Geopyxis carbonaria]
MRKDFPLPLPINMPFKSSIKPLEIPDVDVWDLLFENPGRFYPEDHALFIDGENGDTLDFRKLHDEAKAFGRGLLKQWEWKKGEVLMILSPNNLACNSVMCGVLYAGGVVASANPAGTREALVEALISVKAKAIVTDPMCLQLAISAAENANISSDFIATLSSTNKDGFESWKNIVADSELHLVREEINPRVDAAFIIYTSGTTGVPKAALKTHHTSVYECLSGVRPYEAFLDQAELWKGSKAVTTFPFYLSSTYIIRMCYIYSGMQLIIMKDFSFLNLLELVQSFKATELFLAPPLVKAFAYQPVVASFDMSSVRGAHTWGDVLDVESAYALCRRFNIRLHNQYGMIEASVLANTGFLSPGEHGFASCGTILPNVTAKIISDDTGKEVVSGTLGRLLVKADTIATHYLNHPSLAENLKSNEGYLDTGDFALMYDDLLYVHSRIRDAVVYNGRVIRAIEIERVVVQHSKVQEAVVKGVPGNAGPASDPRAFVVLKPGVEKEKALEMEIEDIVRSQTEMPFWLRGGVRFVDEIPKSPGGKVLRNVLE